MKLIISLQNISNIICEMLALSDESRREERKKEREKVRCWRQKGGAWRSTRVLGARSSFVSHSGAALGSESSGMKRAGTEDPPFLRAVSWCTGSTNRVLFRDVPRRGLQTLAHPLSLSLSPSAFVFKQGETRSFILFRKVGINLNLP